MVELPSPARVQRQHMRLLILLVALLGLAVFGTAFVASYTHPVLAETLARDGIRWEVQRQVGTSLDVLDGGSLAQLAARVARTDAARLAELKRKLADGDLVATVSERMLDPDCACRQAVEASLTGLLEGRVDALALVQARLEESIRTKYRDVAAALTREFRIFTGANAVVFLLLLVVTARRRQAGIHLVLPAIVLVGAAGIVGYFYLFEMDWFQTVLVSDYVGFGYVGYLALAAALLADVVFNRGRICTSILNVALAAVGESVAALPC